MQSNNSNERAIKELFSPVRVIAFLSSVPDWAFLIFLSTVLSLVWILLFKSSLYYYWNFDDFHLVRVFTPWEILESWRGNWDPDFLETYGFRPVTVMFNHVRASLAGEYPAGHRLFLLGLNALLVWVIGKIALKYRLSKMHVVLALSLLMSTKTVMINIVWITPGVLILQWLVAGVAVIYMLKFCDSIFARGKQQNGLAPTQTMNSLYSMATGVLLVTGCVLLNDRLLATWLSTDGNIETSSFHTAIAWVRIALLTAGVFVLVKRPSIPDYLAYGSIALALSWICLLIREDSLIVPIILPILLVGYARLSLSHEDVRDIALRLTRKPFILFLSGLLGIVVVTAFYRQYALLSPGVWKYPITVMLKNYLYTVKWAFLIVGDRLGPIVLTDVGTWSTARLESNILYYLTLLWEGALGILLLVFSLFARRSRKLAVAFCILCVALVSLPALVQNRGDLLLPPLTFVCIALSIMIYEIWCAASLRSFPASISSRQLSGLFSTGLKAICVAFVVLGISGSLYRTKLQQMDMHPMSINQIVRDVYWVFGPGKHAAEKHAVVAERVVKVSNKLCRLGICAESDLNNVLLNYYHHAKVSGLSSPNRHGNPFVGLVGYIDP